MNLAKADIMITTLERLMLTSGEPETQTSPNPGFVMCPAFLLPPAGVGASQEQIYLWAYARAKAQVAEARAAALGVFLDPSWN
jgi:hypothetical protein